MSGWCDPLGNNLSGRVHIDFECLLFVEWGVSGVVGCYLNIKSSVCIRIRCRCGSGCNRLNC